MGKEPVVAMLVVIVAVAVICGGVVIEQAGEAAAKSAEEGLGNIARRAIHKADKILNESNNCKLCPLLIFLSLLAYFESTCY